jgi:cytochrome c-type biogenesis protein CcmH/NrfG
VSRRVAPSRARLERSSARALLVCGLALLAITVTAYWNALDAPFILDDESYIRDDPTIRPPLSLRRLLEGPRPVVALSLALDYARGELDVFPYHLTNVLLHVACGVLLFAFGRFTLLQPALGGRYRRQAGALAFVAASLFLLHPIQTESVTYTIQRAEILASLALLGGVHLAAVAAERSHSRRLLLGVVGIGILGIWSKPTMVVLPLLFGVFDWCFVAEGRWRDMSRRWVIYVALAAVAIGTLLWGVPTDDAATAGMHQQGLMKGIGPWRYLTWQFGVVLRYLQLIVVPDRLCFDCGYLGPWPVKTSWIGDRIWVPAAILVAIAIASAMVRRRYPLGMFAVWAGAIVLIPTSTVMPLADVYVEHRLYLSIGFLALLLVAAAYDASEWLGRRFQLNGTVIRGAQISAAVAVGGILLGLTTARNAYYGDVIRLLEDSASKAPMSRRVHYNLGNEYARMDQPERAITAYQAAIRINDSAARNFVNLGVQYQRLGRFAEAAEAFEAAVARDPQLALAHSNLSYVYERLGNTTGATASLEEAVRLRSGDPSFRRRLGALYEADGRPTDALRQYEAARRVSPADRDLQRRIANLQGSGG